MNVIINNLKPIVEMILCFIFRLTKKVLQKFYIIHWTITLMEKGGVKCLVIQLYLLSGAKSLLCFFMFAVTEFEPITIAQHVLLSKQTKRTAYVIIKSEFFNSGCI